MTNSSSSNCSESGHHHPSDVELDMVIQQQQQQQVANLGGAGIGSEVVFVKCDCCGLTEECTETYIAKVQEKYQGRWICGLCAEAVKDEIFRSTSHHQHQSQESGIISSEEALNRHMNFCNKFRSSTHPPPNPTKHLISAMKQLLRRSSSLSPPPPQEMLTEPRRRLPRSESCFTTLAS